MAQRQLAGLFGSSFRNACDVLGVELLRAHELPVDRPQPVAQLDQALADEALDRFAASASTRPVGAVARGLHREHESIRRLAAATWPSSQA
jgi:hypothetical protein